MTDNETKIYQGLLVKQRNSCRQHAHEDYLSVMPGINETALGLLLREWTK